MENPQVDITHTECWQGHLASGTGLLDGGSACSASSEPLSSSRNTGQGEANTTSEEPSKSSANVVFKSKRNDPFYMMHTVQQSVIFQELDFSYITSRVSVMPYPGEASESACGNRVEDVREYLELRHPGHYAIYNVSGYAYLSNKFHAKIYEAGWPLRKAPPFKTLLSLCRLMYLYLQQDSKNVCVIHCLDGKSSSAVLLCAFLIFCKLFRQPEEALKLFVSRRCPVNMTASQLRYICYVSYVVGNPPLFPHNNTVALHSVSLRPVPLCNECNDWCKPFVEVYIGEECIFTSLEDYENIRYYNFNDKCIVIPITAVVTGDVTIIVYHAKSKFYRIAWGKCDASKLFQLQFHSGFLSTSTQMTIFTKKELDCVEGLGTYPDDFTVTILFNSSYKRSPGVSPLIHKIAQLNVKPEVLFNADEDMEAFTSDLIDKENILECNKLTGNAEFTNNSGYGELNRGSAENSICTDSESDNLVQSIDDLNAFHTVEDELLFVHENDSPLVDLFDVSQPTVDSDNLLGSFHNFQGDNISSTPEVSENSCTDFPQFHQKACFDSSSFEDLSTLFTSGATSTFSKTYSSTQSTPSPISSLSSSMPSFSVNSTSDDGMYHCDSHSPPDCKHRSDTSVKKGHAVNSIPHHTSAPDLKTSVKSDPFADLENIISSFGLPPEEKSEAVHPPFAECNTRRTSAPSQHFHAQQSSKSFSVGGAPQKASNKRSHFSCKFAERNSRGGKKYSSVRPKLGVNEFEDLLGSQGFSGFQRNVDSEPKTIAKLQRMKLVREMDPERLKVLDWVDCKKHNIRALLCSLHTVLWEGTRWQEIGMHRLLSAGDVKRYYRKACLAVHPDKQMGTKNENLAKLIFMELKDAWCKFEK